MKINYMGGWKLETFYSFAVKASSISDLLYRQGQEGCQHPSTPSLMLCLHSRTSRDQSRPVWTSLDQSEPA